VLKSGLRIYGNTRKTPEKHTKTIGAAACFRVSADSTVKRLFLEEDDT
jgi:hypothetical protein